MSLGLIDFFLISGIAAANTVACIIIYNRFGFAAPRAQPDDGIVFLLDDQNLHDLSAAAEVLLTKAGITSPTRQAVIEILGHSYDGLQESLDAEIRTPITLTATDGVNGWLTLAPCGGLIRISVGSFSGGSLEQIETLQFAKESAELLELRDIAKNAPSMMWHSDKLDNYFGQMTRILRSLTPFATPHRRHDVCRNTHCSRN